MALSELQAAAQDNPRLPFVHFSLGLTYLKKQNYEQARDEFLKDAAVEPDLALNYDELGDVYSLMQQDGDAEPDTLSDRILDAHFRPQLKRLVGEYYFKA